MYISKQLYFIFWNSGSFAFKATHLRKDPPPRGLTTQKTHDKKYLVTIKKELYIRRKKTMFNNQEKSATGNSNNKDIRHGI